jgi:hypothetical protein
MSGQDARAALALEAHICTTPHLLLKALREGRMQLPGAGIANGYGGAGAGEVGRFLQKGS